MTSRSLVVGTAALLLLSSAGPVQIGFSPTTAFAQDVSAEVRSALAADPAQLEPAQLEEHLKVLRDAIKAGAFEGRERKTAQEKLKAFRQALKEHRSARKEARQAEKAERQAEKQERRAERTEGQVESAEPEPQRQAETTERRPERQSETTERRPERQSERAERRPERQSERAERRPERQAQTQEPRQAPDSTAQLSPDVIAALRDNRPASELEQPELRQRIELLRTAVRSGVLSVEEREQVQARMRADRDVVESRRAERLENRAEEQASEQPTDEQQADERQANEQRPRRQRRTDDKPQAEVEQQAREIISDNRPADDLDDRALRERLRGNREILETGKLSRDQQRQLRQQLREDRQELRSRVASQQEEQQEADEEEPSSEAADAIDTRDVSRILEQRIPSDQLTERELEQRVRVLRRALNAGNISVREAEVARLLIDRDRSELRDRLHAKRDRRRERRRQARSRNETIIEFNVGYRPPPVIFAAEAMPRDIEVQLVAPPTQQISRSYTVREIATNPDVREMMPGIEIDTLNFDFGSAEVRPEEIDKLDQIGEVIERIVAARPDEVFLIEGHTDAVGSDAANQALSEQRAHAVVEALLDYFAIDPENLQTVGLGERHLRVWTEEPEEENRRVTVRRITPLLAGGQG